MDCMSPFYHAGKLKEIQSHLLGFEAREFGSLFYPDPLVWFGC